MLSFIRHFWAFHNVICGYLLVGLLDGDWHQECHLLDVTSPLYSLKKKSRQNSCFFLNSLLERPTLNLGVILDSIQVLVTSVHFCVLLRSWFCPSPYSSFHYLLLGSSHCLLRSPAHVSARELFKIHTLNRPQNIILLWRLPMLCESYALSPPPRAACVYFYPHVFLSLLFWYASSLDESHTASSSRFIIPNNCLLN